MVRENMVEGEGVVKVKERSWRMRLGYAKVIRVESSLVSEMQSSRKTEC